MIQRKQDPEQLIDRFGRVHTSLRISVTDRCNIRCFYCMPAENVVFRPREELLTFEEIEAFVRAIVPLGINKLRITGGEPLVRSDLAELLSRLAAIPEIEDLALTTNGILLADQAQSLRDAGLQRLNVSLDSLNEEVFEKITRRKGLQKVLDGISAAQRVGFEKIRLNAIAIRGITEDEVVPLANFARKQDLELRFIEFMPLDADGQWDDQQVLTGRRLRQIIEKELCSLSPIQAIDSSQPARDYRYDDGRGRIGFINSVSEPFCDSCNRLRLTAEGKVRNCLFSTVEWDVREILRRGGSQFEIQKLLQECVAAKQPAHGIGDSDFQQPERAMYQIGG